MKERDSKTKALFIEYLKSYPHERFFQAVRNFSREFLDDESNFILSSPDAEHFKDTFNWECDKKLEGKGEL